MAIRFSMSQDNFLKKSTLSQDKQQKSSNSKIPLPSRSESIQSNHSGAENSQRQANCNCTNISVMQLFHEMKQEFPTIPDHVVNQHVIDNCHDRENCKEQLQSEVNCHIVPVLTYPAQQLRVSNKNQMCKKRSQSKNTVPLIDAESCKNSNSNQNLSKNNCRLFRLNDAVSSANNIASNLSEGAQSSAPDSKVMRSGLCNIQIKTYLIDENQLLDVLEKESSTQLPPAVPKRPTTLRLTQEPYSREHNKPELANNQQIVNGNINGRWSSPVVSPNQSQGSAHTPPSTQSSQKIGTTYSASTSIQSPSNYSDARKAEISVNVSLSPGSSRNRGGASQRHLSTINIHPELPYTRNFESCGNNQKSYTSVNLVLRQPSSSPQTPIDITVGPNLTYSSSSYHARLGYQNNYHITVTDDGGVFSAFRIRPINNFNTTVRYSDKDTDERTENNFEAAESVDDDFQDSLVRTSHSNGQSDACKIIMRQHSQMERLSAVLRRNKNKLGLVQKEVKCVMQSTNIDGMSERLDSEIEKLRCDCQAILNEIENSRTYGLSEDSIEHTNSIKSRRHQSFPKQKSLRSPPSSANCSRNYQRLFPIALVNQRQQSIAYHDDDPSDFGVGD